MNKGLFILLFLAANIAGAQNKTITIAEGENAINPSVVINRKNPENFIVASSEGLYYSVDAGKSWQKSKVENQNTGLDHSMISDRKGNLYNFHLSPNSDNRYDKIICQASQDGGATWQLAGAITASGKDIRYPRVCVQGKSSEIMLTWTQYDQYGSENPEHKSFIVLSQSKDGKKWSAPLQINQLAGDCKDANQTPKGAVPGINSKEMMFTVWSMNDMIYVDRSFNKGSTWLTNDIFVSDQSGGWSFKIPGVAKASGLPSLSLDNSPSKYMGSLFLVWADQRKGVKDPDIWFLRSVNFGDNWDTPVRINNDEVGKDQFMPAMAVDQTDGHIYVLFYDRRDHDDEQTDVYLAYSSDNGTTFKNVKISEYPFTPEENTDIGSYISIDAHQGTIVPVWTSYKDGKLSINATVVKRDDLLKSTP